MAWNPDENAVIRRERLRLASPDVVYETLHSYAETLSGNTFSYDEDLERQLLARGDKLVCLALAQFAGKGDIVRSLYEAAVAGTGDAAYDAAVRLAAISNRHAQGVFTSMFGIHVTPLVAALLARGDDSELHALITNPQHRTLLKLLYNAAEPFDKLNDDMRVRLVHYSSRNPGLNINEDSESGPDMQAWDIQKALWNLLRTAPLTESWVTALHILLVNLDPRQPRTASSLEEIEATLARWAPVVVEGYEKGKPREGDYTDLSFVDELRLLIAVLFGRAFTDKKVLFYGQFDSPDVLRRASHYGHAQLKLEDAEKGRDTDGPTYTLAALFNDTVLRNVQTRAHLEEGIGLQNRWLYRRRCEQVAGRVRGFKVDPITDYLAEEMPAPVAGPPAASPEVLKAIAELGTRVEGVKRDQAGQAKVAFWGFCVLCGLIWYFGR